MRWHRVKGSLCLTHERATRKWDARKQDEKTFFFVLFIYSLGTNILQLQIYVQFNKKNVFVYAKNTYNTYNKCQG